jgi:hypothetical protein
MVLARGNAGRGYRPLPAQQGSSPQMGVFPGAHDAPTGSQQQHPLQSIHVGIAVSG